MRNSPSRGAPYLQRGITLFLFFCFTFFEASAAEFLAGFSQVDITPYDFEAYFTGKDGKRRTYVVGQRFFDTGVDRLYDYEEAGAFGEDGQPGRRGVDDDGNGKIDDCRRSRKGGYRKCREYGAPGSDDVYDPAGDNFDPHKNPEGTEGDSKFQSLHLAGFMPYYPKVLPNRFATGVHDPIWSRAMAFRGIHGNVLLLISTDLPGLTWKHINPVRRRVEAELGVPKENIIIASTHLHSAPDGAGFWSTVMKDKNKAYTDRLRQWIFQSARAALQAMEPAKMKTVTTTHVSCFDRKTRELKKEPHCRLPLFEYQYKKDPKQTFDEWILQQDIRDPIVRNTKIVAAQFVSVQSGKTLGTFVNWNNHPEVLSEKNVRISSDYPHYLREYIEKNLGGIAVYFTGTLGGQIGALHGVRVPLWSRSGKPLFRSGVSDRHGHPVRRFVEKSGFDKIRSIGFEIGNEVVSALAKESRYRLDVPVKVRTEAFDTPVDNALHVWTTRSVWFFDVAYPDRMRRYSDRCGNRFGCVRSDVSVIRLGDLSLVTLPGEVDPAYFFGRKKSVAHYGFFWGKKRFPAMPSILDAMEGQHRAVLGQAHNYLSYLVHEPDNIGWWNDQHPLHYEEFVTIGRHFGDDAANKLMQLLGSPKRYSDRKIFPRSP